MKLYRISKLIKEEYLPVSAIHSLYIAQYGNPKGIPLVRIHGGPGSPSKPKHTKFYNPDKYRIILYDQRGVGKSKPLGELKENNTQELIADMEKIRKHLEIDKWVVSGRSWGSTLALLYAEKHPDRVIQLLTGGIFTFRKMEIDWFTKPDGARYFFPDNWEKYKNDPLLWEDSVMTLVPREIETGEKTPIDKASEKIFMHYEKNKGFLKEGEILNNAHKLKGVPGVIIQGRYDMVCPPITAWELSKAWPKAKLVFTIAGHQGSDKESADELIRYTDKLAEDYHS